MGSVAFKVREIETLNKDVDGVDILQLKNNFDSHVHTFASLTSKPTTISGFGIIDSVGNGYSNPIYETFTWTIPGEVKVPSGDTDFINPMFILMESGWTYKITKVRYKINSGTSVTIKLQKNGVDITGFTAISVTTTAGTTDPTDIDLANNDVIVPVVTAVSGTPKNMSITIQIAKYK